LDIGLSNFNFRYDLEGGQGRNVYRVLMETPKEKTLERPRRRWEDGIKVDLMEIGWGVWSGFSWLRIGTVGGVL
jgi:hypothetical protein